MRLLLVLVAACGASTSQISIGPPPPPSTAGVLVGPLCAGDHCECRDNRSDDGGAGVPSDTAHKRFEIRLKSPQAIWATVGSVRLYKNVERAEACFYVDLPAGVTPVELRASDPNGAAAAWEIHELGTKTKSYYDTFSFNCGVPGACSFDELDSAKAEYANLAKHVRDKCGSTKIKQLTWDSGHAPDQMHPSELLVRLQLDVYTWAPWKEHGDPSCGQGKPPGEGSAEQSDVPENADDAP